MKDKSKISSTESDRRYTTTSSLFDRNISTKLAVGIFLKFTFHCELWSKLISTPYIFQKSKFLDLFDERAFGAINCFITKDASKERSDSFFRIFNSVSLQTRKRDTYVTNQLFDRCFHIANIYGNGLFSPEGVNRVATWLSSAPDGEMNSFKDVMGALKSTVSHSRPTSVSHSSYAYLPNYVQDRTLSLSAKDTVEQASIQQYLYKKSKHDTKRQAEEYRQRLEKEKKLMTDASRFIRPNSAPASRRSADFGSKKPYGLYGSNFHHTTTQRTHFASPAAQYKNKPVRIGNNDDKRMELIRSTTERMNFIPKALMATASLGVVVPSSDSNYLLNTVDEPERLSKQQTRQEELSRSLSFSKTSANPFCKSTYKAHFVPTNPVSNLRVRTAGRFKRPFGDYPEFERKTEYASKYSEDGYRTARVGSVK